MENFFIDHKFYHDIDDLMNDCDIEEDNLNEVSKDWSVKAETSELEPMFTIGAAELTEMLADKYEDRYDEEGSQSEDVRKALEKCIDFDTLNKIIPSLYYPTGEFVTITKSDLIEYCK